MLVHPFEPVYDSCSKILILGTFPSVKSREENFYYGHPHNRFWKVLSALTGCPLPRDIKEKKDLLLKEKLLFGMFSRAARLMHPGIAVSEIL